MKKTYVQLGGSVVLLIAAAAAYVVWYGEVRTESGQIADIQSQIQEKSQAATRIAQAKIELTSLAPEIDSVDQYFLSTDNIVPFLGQLASTGKFLGADVEVVSVSATPGSPHGTLDLSLTITGSFDSVMRTLGSIEYSPYDVRTTSVTLNDSGSASGNATSTDTWQANGIFTIGMQSGTQPAPVEQAPQAQPAATSTASTPATTTPATSTPVTPAASSSGPSPTI